mmetsp:Transcript_16190/g.35478  ORF Transcript_16190/g.35478 Transcript_16190/m.35478 type:complete len:276 (-) Transcript_16190:74-901(-)
MHTDCRKTASTQLRLYIEMPQMAHVQAACSQSLGLAGTQGGSFRLIKAVMPSAASCDWKHRAETSDVHRKASSTGIPGTSWSRALVAARALGPPSKSFPMSSSTLASNSLGWTEWFSRPIAAALSAVIRSPLSISSAASPLRSFGRQTTEMMAGATPSLTSAKATVAELLITEMSQAAAMPTPPPTQWPLILPMTTLGPCRKSINSSGKLRRGGPPEFFRSAPAQNVPPSLVSTMRRTAQSDMQASRLSHNESKRAALNEFLSFGRLRIIVATPS